MSQRLLFLLGRPWPLTLAEYCGLVPLKTWSAPHCVVKALCDIHLLAIMLRGSPG